MNHRDEQILKKVIQEMNIVADMISNKTLEEFQNDEMLKRAVCMTVINIGELIKNITEDFRKQNNQVPWKAIAGFRDVTAH